MNDYVNHLKRISIHDNFLSIEECDRLIRFFDSSTHVNDRSVFRPNKGVKNDIGKYKAIGITPETQSDIYFDIFNDKTINGISPNEIQINKYNEGDFIPPHKDQGLSLYTVCVPLQTNPDNILVFGDPAAYYDEMDLSKSNKMGITKSFPDIKGIGYRFDGTDPIHWVPPIKTARYSAIILYGF